MEVNTYYLKLEDEWRKIHSSCFEDREDDTCLGGAEHITFYQDISEFYPLRNSYYLDGDDRYVHLDCLNYHLALNSPCYFCGKR